MPDKSRSNSQQQDLYAVIDVPEQVTQIQSLADLTVSGGDGGM